MINEEDDLNELEYLFQEIDIEIDPIIFKPLFDEEEEEFIVD